MFRNISNCLYHFLNIQTKSRSKDRLGVKMFGIHFHLMPMMMAMMAMIILLWMLTIYCHRGFIGWLRLHWAEREMATIGKGKAVSSNKGYLLMIFITNILLKHKRTFE